MSTTHFTSNLLSHVLNHYSNGSDLTERLFSRKELIPFRNDVLWRIEQGVVRTLILNEDAKFVTLGYWGAGDVIGYSLSKVQPYQIECMTNVEASMIPRHLWYKDLDAFLSHIRHSQELLSIVHLKPASLRLGKFLLWLTEKFGRNVPQGKLIDYNITHQEVSEVLNLTRVTVTRMLKEFEHQGALFRYKRRIIILSANKLILNYDSVKK